MARNLYPIRHGQVKSPFKATFVGDAHADFSPAGLAPAVRLNNVLSRISPHIRYSSPMRRCLQTAQQAMVCQTIEFVHQQELRRDADVGDGEGPGFNDVVRLYAGDATSGILSKEN
jgi:broad specificity phosphatase PhoE